MTSLEAAALAHADYTAPVAMHAHPRLANSPSSQAPQPPSPDDTAALMQGAQLLLGSRPLNVQPKIYGHGHTLSAPAFSMVDILGLPLAFDNLRQRALTDPCPIGSTSSQSSFTGTPISSTNSEVAHMLSPLGMPVSASSYSSTSNQLPSAFGPLRKPPNFGHRRVQSAAIALTTSHALSSAPGDQLRRVPTGNLTESSGNLFDLKDPPGGINDRPSYSYVVLIRYAILGSASQKMTLQDIYEAIEERYPFFRDTNKGWRNSVRHNLSLNKCFKKQGRHILDPGKGNYWTVDLAEELCTARQRNRKPKGERANSAQLSISSLAPSSSALTIEESAAKEQSPLLSLSPLSTEAEIRSWFSGIEEAGDSRQIGLAGHGPNTMQSFTFPNAAPPITANSHHAVPRGYAPSSSRSGPPFPIIPQQPVMAVPQLPTLSFSRSSNAEPQ